jgi:uncharacterized protein HemY
LGVFQGWLLSRAIPLLERSVKQASQNADFSYHLGMATLQLGDWDKARTLLERALKLNPRLADAENAKECPSQHSGLGAFHLMRLVRHTEALMRRGRVNFRAPRANLRDSC